MGGLGSCFFPKEDDPSHAPALLSCLSSTGSPSSHSHPHTIGTISQTNSRGPIRRRTASFVWPELFPDSDSDSSRTSLLVAAFNGKEDKVRELLLRDDVNPNISYSNGNTPLIIAVQENHTNIVHMLLQRPDIKVNMRGLDGYTALIRACFERSDIVRILVKRPDVDVNLASYYGTTALTFAIRNGNAAAVNELLKHPRINLNYQSKHGENGLFEAVSYKRMDIVEMLLNHQNCEVDIVDQHDRTPFLVACQYGYEDIACALIARGCDTTVEDDCARNGLYHAVKRNREVIIHALLDRRHPDSLKCQCRSVIRKYLRSFSIGISIKNIILKIPKHELPSTLVSYLIFEPEHKSIF